MQRSDEDLVLVGTASWSAKSSLKNRRIELLLSSWLGD